uniref:NADH dehydrogenase subunit 4 n=1 Tax=Navis striatus TaxID=1580118 RepID=UPI0007393195|nr:NADH dehydrogenase subunit 4 [Navis striatus]AIZ58460.1 NADH dehydrogenase subunit 4 [Navis striatus]AIZ58473.1 NADH dehydrogenase subunit 4 [Navis striatus]QLD97032.1 NADH dehydrogenase subunit 4 [Navis striatus]QLD97045.1 NADH dehydrogenase subunit 4 [Navis striatus]
MFSFLFLILGLFWMVLPLDVMVSFMISIFFLMILVDWEGLWMNYVGGLFGLDLMGFNLVMLSMWISMLMIIASFKKMELEDKKFFFYVLMMALLLSLCFSCLNLLGFFLFFESVLFPIIMMIFKWGVQPERLQAGIYMLFYTLFGSMPLFIFLLFSKSSLDFLFLYFEKIYYNNFVFFMIVVAFFVKIPMFIFHLWLPKAHVEAPIGGSMILAGVLLKLGIFGLYRFKIFYIKNLMEFSSWVMSVCLVGGVYISMVCLVQVDLKSLIAYSSVCHMSLALGGFLSLNYWGGLGSLLMMLGHGLCSSGLFCLANIMYERFFTRSVILLKGVGFIFPFLSMWWFFFCVINMAAPPSMNLLGEILLMGSMLKYSFFLLFPLCFISFFSASFSLYMYSYTQHGKGWCIFSVNGILMREYFLMFLHFFPLVLWVMKMELVTSWLH